MTSKPDPSQQTKRAKKPDQKPKRRWLRRIGCLTFVLVFGLMLIPIGFRLAAFLRESAPGRSAAPAEGRFVEVAGHGLYIQTWGDPSDPAVLFIHGTMAWSKTWYEVGEHMAANGYYAIAVDLPPFGYSDRPAAHNYGRLAQAGRIVGLLDAMSIDEVVLVGHSFGGGATVEAAILLGPRLRGLGLFDVALGLLDPNAAVPGAPLTEWDGFRETMVATFVTNPMTTGSVLESFTHDPSVIDDARVAIYQEPFNVEGLTHASSEWVVSGLYADDPGAVSHNLAILAQLNAPTLVIWGHDDTVTPLAQGQHIHSLLPNSELVVLPGSNHLPHVEHPVVVNASLIAFLARLPTE